MAVPFNEREKRGLAQSRKAMESNAPVPSERIDLMVQAKAASGWTRAQLKQ
jgi:DNA repair photolyase